MLNKVTITILTTSRMTRNDPAIATAVRDGRSYREMLTATQQRHRVIDDLVLPWSRYYNWLWRYQLGPDYPNLSPKLMVELLVPLRKSIDVGVTNDYVTGVEAELIWHPFAVTTVVHLRLSGESWHADQLATVLDDVLRSSWAGTTIQVRNGLPLPAMSLNWDLDTAGRPSGLSTVATSIFVSGLHHGERLPGALASALASLFTDSDSDADSSYPLRVSGGHLGLRGRNVGLVLPNSTRNAERAHRCFLANNSALLAIIENMLTLRGATGLEAQTAKWYWDKAKVILDYLYTRTDNPTVGTVYKSRLAQLWLDRRNYP